MFARLSYLTGTLPSSIVDDLVALLTGATSLSGLSARLDVPNSYLNAAVPGTWELVASPTTATDLYNATPTLCTGAVKLLRQTVKSKNSDYKYLKLAVCNISSVGFLLANIGTNHSTGTLTTQANRTLVNNALNLTTAAGVPMSTNTAAALFARPVTITVHSSAGATLVLIGHSGGFNDKHAFSVIDFANNWADPSNFIPTAILGYCNPSNYGETIVLPPSADQPTGHEAGTPFMLCPGGAINLANYGSSSATAITPCLQVYPTIKDVAFSNSSLMYLCDPAYKFAGFKSTGTTYDMFPFGIGSVSAQSGATGTTYEAKYSATIPYCDISNLTGVYLCNYYAFGQLGRVYQTPNGPMCKFGIFMASV